MQYYNIIYVGQFTPAIHRTVLKGLGGTCGEVKIIKAASVGRRGTLAPA